MALDSQTLEHATAGRKKPVLISDFGFRIDCRINKGDFLTGLFRSSFKALAQKLILPANLRED
jgi:hypothetical protein